MADNTPQKQAAQNLDDFKRLLGGIRYGLSLVFVASIGLNLLVLTSPIYMMQVYDRVLLTGSLETLAYLTAICLVAMAVMGVLDAARSATLSRIGAWFERTLRFELLNGILRVAFERGNSFGLQLIGDLHNVKAFLGSNQVAPVFDAPWVPIFLAVIWIIHPWLGMFAIGAAVVLFSIALATDLLTRAKMKEVAGDQVAFSRFSQQVVSNHDIVLGMGMASAVFERMRTALDRLQTDGVRINDIVAMLSGLSKFVRMFVQMGILGLGAYLVLEGSLTSGGMLGASIILGRALAPVEQAIGSWRSSVGAVHAFQRIRQFFTAAGFSREEFSLPAVAGALSVETLVYAPPGSDKPILRNVNLSLKPATVLAVIGPSGAGKTTLCRLLVGSLKPRAGHVRIDGADVGMWNRDELGRFLGYLPQTIELFEGTVRDNIARFRDVPDAEVVRAAELAGCHDMILRLSKGYLTEVGEAGAYLSGGERQRIGLARAVFGGPRVLVLDEPNSNLDHDGEAALVRAMIELKKRGCTTVIVTHRPSLLAAVDLVAILRDGTVEKIGERDAVLRDLGVQPLSTPRPVHAANAG